MEEIKIGEYARTYEGNIGKIIDLDIDVGICTDIRQKALTIDAIKKHSKNIIDLIEVGDYVNGSKVIEVDNFKGYMKEIYCEDDKDFGIWEEMIDTVLTHEQFKQVEYKI